MIWIGIIGLILTAVGDIIIGISVLQVHSTISRERRIDETVIKEVKEEKLFVATGIIFVMVGFILNVISLTHLYN